MQELQKNYNPKETEADIYSMWEKSDAFKPKIDENQKPFVITIPPPNVTGSLHMGHALNNTIQDILIRRARMRGIPTLWLPGTDHAGIATQNVVEKKLAKEGIKKQDLSREEFIQEIEKWVDQYGHTIIDQLKKMGCSCDWSRQRYTMDDDYAEAVNTAFKHYFDKDLIYQGERVINWCVRCQTSLSDIEVEYVEQKAKLYFLKYDQNFPISIATTRPETKLGDTAVAVNPSDDRYKNYIGQSFEVNFAGTKRQIKIIADPAIDKTYGTGAVGVTPAHSMADAEMAEKNNLESITVIDRYGKMTAEAGPDFAGLKVKEAREKILEWLKQENLLEKTEDITNNLSVCYRCNREIEPQPSKQWFLKMSELIKPAIAAIKNDEIKITPAHWKKVYIDWMENIRDWCISRQIIWGHRLPVWIPEGISNSKFQIQNENLNSNFKIDSKLKIENSADIYVGSNPPKGYEQSSDVLDTWFSSALWPFATLGWPQQAESVIASQQAKQSNLDDRSPRPDGARDDKANDLCRFYPTTMVVTARDINMLWVVRMIFSGLEFMNQKPFSAVHINPTVFNKEGKRMSKSLGTGVDPLELINKYGADATRFGLMYMNTGTQDIKFDEAAILAGQKFANKLWNIARFIMMQIDDSQLITNDLRPGSKTEADKKILARLQEVVKSTDENLDKFRFGQATHDLYDFVWHDFADVYIEASKKQMDGPGKANTRAILLNSLFIILKLLHPFMPFVTESIWQNLKQNQLVKEETLAIAKWPN